MNAVEINTSFYKPHRRQTYEKWAGLTPANFRFSVKVPKAISHEPTFETVAIERFICESAGLGEKLAILLVQFPPSKPFDRDAAGALFSALKSGAQAAIVCEPRHASWFTRDVEEWLADRQISRAAADPPRIEGAGEPGGWVGLNYFRLHGSPRIYYSSYDEEFLRTLGETLAASRKKGGVWCIFDNTAAGAALENALTLRERGIS